jgi:hypothetical protein
MISQNVLDYVNDYVTLEGPSLDARRNNRQTFLQQLLSTMLLVRVKLGEYMGEPNSLIVII